MSDRLENSLKFCAKNSESFGGYLYIIKCNQYVKIGYARDFEMRFCNMQIGNPYDLKLLVKKACKNPSDEEALLHKEFEKYHWRGEWFLIPDDKLEELLLRYGVVKSDSASIESAVFNPPKCEPKKKPYNALRAVTYFATRPMPLVFNSREP